MIYYYSKGSGALAAHILLEEAGATYETRHVSIPDKEHHSPAFLEVNPKARLPALQTGQGVLTENPAILAYIAQTHPAAGLAPEDPWAFAQAQALNAFVASTVHIAFAHKQRGSRWTDDADAQAAMRAAVPQKMRDCADLLETHYIKGPFALGAQYSMCDPYLFQVSRWMTASDVPLDAFPKLAALAAAVRARPATQRAMAIHEL